MFNRFTEFFCEPNDQEMAFTITLFFIGLLVCFNLPGRYSGRLGSGGEPTPRYNT